MHADGGAGLADGDVAAAGAEIGLAADARGADMSAAGMQRGIAGDFPDLNVTAAGGGVEFSGHIADGDMAALGFEVSGGFAGGEELAGSGELSAADGAAAPDCGRTGHPRMGGL